MSHNDNGKQPQKPSAMEKRSSITVRGNRNVLPELYKKETDRIKKLDRDLMVTISAALMKGLSPQDAAAVAFIGAQQFEDWHGAGKALLEGSPNKHIPELLPSQPGEEESIYIERKQEWLKECDLYVDFYLLCNQAQQVLNESMMGIIIDFAKSSSFDRWRAAKEVLKMTNSGYDEKSVQTHQHQVSGSVEHSHESPQIQVLLENIAKSFGTALPAKTEEIVEGEIIDVAESQHNN